MTRPHAPSDRSRLRRELRARRQAISPARQRHAARALARRLAALAVLKRARHVALYWPVDGEIDPRPLLRLRHAGRHRFYLPVLRPFPAATLGFAPWRAATRLWRNRFGIPEPRARRPLPARRMDAVLVPLTGFDAAGNRLGMGGGFYDRTFAFRRHARHRPLLVGVAHACQQLDAITSAPWDVPLGIVVTDRGTFR